MAHTGTLIQTRCEARYCVPGVGIGVEFVDVSADTVRAIEDEMGLQPATE